MMEGQAWRGEVQSPYDRLPSRAEKTVNAEVWGLSHNSAGLYIKFKTNAHDLVVRYVLKGSRTLPHMPVTGISGVDLYAIDVHGNWVWAQISGEFKFGDTVEYRYSAMKVCEGMPEQDFEFRLYLPLYNGVQWMRIGMPVGKRFTPMPLSPEKPVVVYGISIAQGGCCGDALRGVSYGYRGKGCRLRNHEWKSWLSGFGRAKCRSLVALVVEQPGG